MPDETTFSDSEDGMKIGLKMLGDSVKNKPADTCTALTMQAIVGAFGVFIIGIHSSRYSWASPSSLVAEKVHSFNWVGVTVAVIK